MTDPHPDWHGPAPEKHLAVYLTGANAETAEPTLDGAADADGHVVVGTVFRRDGGRTPAAPVSVRVSHGTAPATAAAMLRKMADLVEAAPALLSGKPGRSARRGPGGEPIERQITVEALLEQAGDLHPEVRDRLFDALDQIRDAISDDERPPGD